MVKVGVIGVGGMGTTHLDAYSKVADAQVVAVADLLEERRTGAFTQKGNIKGQAEGGHDFSAWKQYDEGMKLIADPEIELVDVCLPTPLHHPFVLAALKAGKHVITEKPFSLTGAQADEMVAAAKDSPGVLMCALCMRFWPAWSWLRDRVAEGTYGKVYSALFRRVAQNPGRWFADGAQSGGGILDLHIHDVDFVQYCFGRPTGVFSRGYIKDTGAVDHATTQFIYPDIPLVVAEGGWSMANGYGFKMQYEVNFESATAVFDISGDPQLTVRQGGETTAIEVAPGAGYEYELRYLIDCIQKGEQPKLADAESAAYSIKLVEAEVESIKTGQVVAV